MVLGFDRMTCCRDSCNIVCFLVVVPLLPKSKNPETIVTQQFRVWTENIALIHVTMVTAEQARIIRRLCFPHCLRRFFTCKPDRRPCFLQLFQNTV